MNTQPSSETENQQEYSSKYAPMQQRLGNWKVWGLTFLRILYCLVTSFLLYWIVFPVILIQVVFYVVYGAPNKNLSNVIELFFNDRLMQFVSFRSDKLPFPFEEKETK